MHGRCKEEISAKTPASRAVNQRQLDSDVERTVGCGNKQGRTYAKSDVVLLDERRQKERHEKSH